MSLKKTETVALDESEDWGSLVPIPNTQPLPTYSLSKDSILMGRSPDCLICINDKRLSGKHCEITKQGSKVMVTDLSTNGTFINSKKIGKGKSVELKHQEQLWMLMAGPKVETNQTIGFKFDNFAAAQELKKKKEEGDIQKQKQQEQKDNKTKQEMKKLQEEQQKLKKQKQETNKFSDAIKQQITCSFCFQIMCLPVAIQPCNHRFCGGCLTELVNSKKDTCIQCRKQITTAVRDTGFTSIIDDYIKSHPAEKRDPKEEEEQKAKSIFGFDPINIQEKIHGKIALKTKIEIYEPPMRGRGRGRRRRAVRVNSDLSASDDDEKDKCRECLTARNGFRCTGTQVHIACHTCAKLIPSRDDPDLLQCCSICTTYYCNLYYPPCKAGAKLNRLLDLRQKCKIDTDMMRGNKFQFEVIRNFLMLKKMNSRDLFDRMIGNIEKGKFTYAMDRKVMRVAPLVARSIKLTKNSAVCDNCWNDLWFQMVLSYRMEIVTELPANVRDRPSCYWGINCRTMDHNQDHARNYNHCIYQTRF